MWYRFAQARLAQYKFNPITDQGTFDLEGVGKERTDPRSIKFDFKPYPEIRGQSSLAVDAETYHLV